MAASVADFTLVTGSSGATSVGGSHIGQAVEVIVDLTKDAADNAHTLINDGDGVAATETIDLMYIPAGSIVERVIIHVEEASTIDDLDIGAILTADDEVDDADGFVDGATLVTTTSKVGGGAYASADTLGKLFTAEHTMQALVNTAGTHTTGVFRVVAIIIPPNP